MHCCGCMIDSSVGIISGRTPLDDLEDELNSLGARKDVYLAFVLRWETVTDIDSWMIEPNGTAIGYSTQYRKQLEGVQSFNYILDDLESTINLNDSGLTSNKGNLDKDCISCSPIGIENLVYFGREYMQDGIYTYRLDDYSGDHTKGFKVYIIERNKQLEPVGFAELEWEGEFSHPRLQDKAQIMVQMKKTGNALKFKLVHPRLKLKNTYGFNWVEQL